MSDHDARGWAGYWSRTPHIRFGDPCYGCGVPLVPACRTWPKELIPAGMRKHAGRALCGTCKGRFYRGTLTAPGIVGSPSR